MREVVSNIRDGAKEQDTRRSGRAGLSEQPTMIRLSPMHRPLPDGWGAERSLGSVVRRLDAGRRDERPEGGVQGDQAAAGFSGTLIKVERTLSQPIAQIALNRRELSQERS